MPSLINYLGSALGMPGICRFYCRSVLSGAFLSRWTNQTGAHGVALAVLDHDAVIARRPGENFLIGGVIGTVPGPVYNNGKSSSASCNSLAGLTAQDIAVEEQGVREQVRECEENDISGERDYRSLSTPTNSLLARCLRPGRGDTGNYRISLCRQGHGRRAVHRRMDPR